MGRYFVGSPGANGFDANEPISVLWNPSASIALRVVLLRLQHNSTFARVDLVRTTTRGTPGSTTTPDADNHSSRRAGPPSGALLDRGNYTATPTQATPPLACFLVSDPNGSAVEVWLPEPIIVPPGSGLGLWSPVQTATAWTTTFEWEE